MNGHLESAQILLEAGADPNGSRHHRSTPVYHASRVGRADILKALIRSVLGLRPAAAAAFSFLIFSPSQSRLVTGFVCFVFFKSCFLAFNIILIRQEIGKSEVPSHTLLLAVSTLMTPLTHLDDSHSVP